MKVRAGEIYKHKTHKVLVFIGPRISSNMWRMYSLDKESGGYIQETDNGWANCFLSGEIDDYFEKVDLSIAQLINVFYSEELKK